MPLPDLGAEADKEARGRALVVGGSRQVPGALILAGLGALSAGAGKLQIATGQAAALALAIAMPEARVIGLETKEDGEPNGLAAEALRDEAERARAVILGPGMFDEAGAGDLVLRLLNQPGEAGFVIDAAALTGLAGKLSALKPTRRALVLTPHFGEMAALLGLDLEEVEADPAAVARRVAHDADAVVALKSKETWIAAPDGQVLLHRQKALGLGTAGSGDVLAGVIGGLLARGASPLTAAAWGVFAHGQAGLALEKRYDGIGYLAREIPGEVPAVLAGSAA